MKYSAPIAIEQAIQMLKSNDVVAIPTETVYGLAGAINNESALNKIFSIKGRPFFDPLIVHVSSIEMAQSLVKDWPKAASVLYEKFWPGPLTLVLPKNDKVSDLVTAGLKTVALRMPDHVTTLKMIDELQCPVAAPSANRFGKTSPTDWQHVQEEFAGEVAVVDGGASEVGVESTIVRLQDNNVELLRPGTILFSDIQSPLSSIVH